MKVWNREVKECNDCGFCEYIVDIDGKTAFRCKETGYLVRHDSIDDQCPFNKPITNKVIESFGFKSKFIEPDNQYHLREWVLLDFGKNIYEIYKYMVPKSTVFKGELNNSEELRFILKKSKIIK